MSHAKSLLKALSSTTQSFRGAHLLASFGEVFAIGLQAFGMALALLIITQSTAQASPMMAMSLIFSGIGLRLLVQWCQSQYAFQQGKRAQTQVRLQLHHLIEAQGIETLAQQGLSQWAFRLGDFPKALSLYYSDFVPASSRAMLVPLLISLGVMALSPMLGLFFLMLSILAPLCMALAGIRTQKVARSQLQQLAVIRQQFGHLLSGLASLKRWGRASEHIQQLESVNQTFRTSTLRVLKSLYTGQLGIDFLILFALMGSGWGIYHLLSGSNPTPLSVTLLLPVLLAPELLLPIRGLSRHYHAKQKAIEVCATLSDLGVKNWDVPPDAEPAAQTAAPSLHVSGQHMGNPLSFTLPPKARLAITGPSGSGKTRLLYRLAGLQMDNHLDVHWAPSTPSPIGWSQSNQAFPSGSMKASLQTPHSDEKIWPVLDALTLSDWVKTLPNGLQTCLGQSAQGLSGGQQARLNLAKAMLTDSKVMMWDEPLAHLPEEDGQKILQALFAMRPNSTFISTLHHLDALPLFTHRLDIRPEGIQFSALAEGEPA